ncbi:hypothetical protein H9P43_008844 [Blastocladiella emersonii ATCC 22665]|nr:hypothetical protein H9P43_008844 [Blastocladiella emersonii ATCC 22665]
MPRTIQDITDIAHGVLLGAALACMAWLYLNRDIYMRTRIAKMQAVIVFFVALRLLSSIRLESSNPAACYTWILLRSTVSLFAIFSLNLYYQTELFYKLAVKNAAGQWRRVLHRGLHGVTQAINLANLAQYLGVMSAFTNKLGFCALYEADVVPLTVLTCASFGTSLAMNLYLLTSKTNFMAMAAVARLFRATTISTCLLCCWVIFIHLDSLYAEWQDWKSIWFTIMLVWMSLSSLVTNNFLISQRSLTLRQARAASSRSRASQKDRGTAATTTMPVSTRSSSRSNSVDAATTNEITVGPGNPRINVTRPSIKGAIDAAADPKSPSPPPPGSRGGSGGAGRGGADVCVSALDPDQYPHDWNYEGDLCTCECEAVVGFELATKIAATAVPTLNGRGRD